MVCSRSCNGHLRFVRSGNRRTEMPSRQKPWLPLLALGLAAAGPVVYGDWRLDAPGVERRITVQDLPPPAATPSVSNHANIVRRPSGMLPKAPPGFAVQLFAAG